MSIHPRLLFATSFLLCALFHGSASPVINEIMFHPPGSPVEAQAKEWIEIYNPSLTTAVDVSGWKLSKGVSFTIPPATILSPAGYLVVAANVAEFESANPGFEGDLVGGWTGQLADGGETIQLDDALGVKVNDVTYADEGDWALRGRGPLPFTGAGSGSARGWDWFSDADGGGKTIELRNPTLGNGNGQNWGVSAAVGGSPGGVNWVASLNVAPLIKDVKHRPEIPRTTDPIVVSCNLEDEAAGATATLRWRVDGGGSFNTLAMSDTDGDGDVEATIPAQTTNLTVIEWYISATDGTLTRTWPAPARTSNPGVLPETFAQEANALIQVDNTFDPNLTFTAAGNQPWYRIIMTELERVELQQIGDDYAGKPANEQESQARMNATFISHDGTGIDVVYLSGVRNRGGLDTASGSPGSPNNYHVSFRSDDRWNDRSSFQINGYYPHSQVLGNSVFDLAGVPPQEAAVVRLRVNGANLAVSDARMYGRYARLEGRSGEWARRHYPNDSEGNFYRLDDHFPDTPPNPPGDLGSGEFRYEGANPLAYSDTFIKETNQDDPNGYADLIDLCRVISASPTADITAGDGSVQPKILDADYPAAVSEHLDLDQFYRFIATDALIGNREGGLQSGRGDDVSIYRGVSDPRFRFIPHDLDDVFLIGQGLGQDPVVRSIFSYDGQDPSFNGSPIAGMRRLFNHPQLVPRYYAAVLDAMNTWFTHATLDPLIDQLLGVWAPAAVTTAKSYIDQRRANVLTQIPQGDLVLTNDPAVYTLTAIGNAADVNGMKQTTDGAATISGTFNVAKTYSITVNGTLATMFSRTAGADAAGTWKLVTTAGSGFLNRGINHLTVKFFDGINGTGNVLKTLTVDPNGVEVVLYYSGGAQTTIAANGVPLAGSLGLTAPDSYVPGVPVMVRVDVRNSQGATDRALWNGTATLTATNGVTLVPNTVTLYNGVGSALVAAGGGTGTTQTLFSYGTGGTGTTGSGVAGSQWKAKSDFTTSTLATFITNIGNTWRNEGFNDSTWTTVFSQAGYGNSDENTLIADIDYDPVVVGSQNVPCYLFRGTFTIADVNALTSVTGQIKYDDGYAIYVNGQDINQRLNTTAGLALSSYATGSSADNATAAVTIPIAALHNGVNTIAVEIRQANSTSSDVTFDLRLQANFPPSNPGNFTLTATANGLSNAKPLTSLNGVAHTIVSGPLAGNNTWSGIVHVTGDVTVPAGATLTIDPGTHVLIDGTTTSGDTTGKKITINGTLTAPGTLASPISITSFDPNARWGQFLISAAQPTVLDYCLISHGAHAPATLAGQPNPHTGKGSVFLVNGANVTLRDCVVAESPGKAMYTLPGTCDITLQRSLMTRLITGPELQDGTSLLCEDTNIQEILPTLRESNDLVPDDEDCLYVHNAPGRSVIIRRCAFARCGDDVIDLLAGPITIEDSILRQGWDKGVSLLNNDLTIVRTQIIDCDKAISLKSSTAPATRTVTMDHCTVSSEEHDTTTAPWGYSVSPAAGDPDAPATGLWTQNKAGQSNTSAVLRYIVSNSIIEAKFPINVDSPYPAANTMLIYTATHDTDTVGTVAPGTGNIEAIPLFVDSANKDFHLQTTSPCKNTGDPVAPLDADGTRTDMGALPFGGGGGGGTPTNILWSLANSPFRITTDVTIPTGSTLTIEPGVSVFVDENKHILVNGKVNIVGTANQHITLRGVPGLPLKADPADAGLPLTSPKWGGLWIENSMNPENIISYVDFVDAQDILSGSKGTSRGCIEVKNSQAMIDHCTFRGTHLHMIYCDFASVIVQYCTFPDMFAPGELPGTLDNVAEHVKMVNMWPVSGHCIIRWNTFGGNKGHNDVLDIDSLSLPNPILQIRENQFNGLFGDECLDLGGDVLIDGNIIRNGRKDQWNNSGGYGSGFSTGDAGGGTTIVVTRGIFSDIDHATALKSGTAAIFEHNTFYKLHPNFTDGQGRLQRAGVIAFVVPEEGTPPGDGAYVGNNIFWNVPVIFGQADVGTGGNGTFPTKLQADYNILDPATSTTVGVNHPGGFFSLGVGNYTGNPLLINPDNGDFSLASNSPARGATVFGDDLGGLIPGGARITGEPPTLTPSTSATLTVGGPGVFYYKWKLDGGAWSSAIAIDPANPLHFPRNAPTIRTAQLQLTNLAPGAHTVSVIGQDYAGVWQEEAGATVSKTWTVNPALQLIQINEVLADSATLPDTIELYNAGAGPVNIGGWSLTDDPAAPAKYVIPVNTTIPSGGYLTIAATASGISLDRNGDIVQLRNGAALVDSVSFGNQITGLTIGRIGQTRAWALCTPTLGTANAAVRLGAPTVVRLSEWFTSGDVLYDADWVELANPTALPINIAGLRITDNRAGNPLAHVFAPLTFIGANGFARFIADGNPAQGPSHLDFSFDAQQEGIALLDAVGAQIDIVFFPPQTTDYSMGRDAGGNLVFYELPTRGFVNGTSDPAYANALAILRGLRISEIMYNAIGGPEFDYIELTNIGASPLALGGVSFVQGITFTFPAMTLNPGEFVVVVKNLSSFRSRYGNGPVVAPGVFIGQLDNGGETIGLQLPPPFDANALTFAYNDAWYPPTDGFGPSIFVPNLFVNAGVWGDRGTWAASPVNGGNPGGATATQLTYSGWSVIHTVLSVTEDDDLDAVPALVEFSLGMSNENPNAGDGQAGLPRPGRAGDGRATLSFLVPENLTAVQSHGFADVTYRVQAADILGTWTTIATKSFSTIWSPPGNAAVGAASGGYVPVTITDIVPPGTPPRFLRLQMGWTP